MYSVVDKHKSLKKKHFPATALYIQSWRKFKNFTRLYKPCFQGDINPNSQSPLTMAWKKGPSGSLEQVHFLAEQVNFKAHLPNKQNSSKSSSNKIINLGCVPLGWSGSRKGIQDHLMNPLWIRIPRFFWSIMIRVITDHWSWCGSSQRKHP